MLRLVLEGETLTAAEDSVLAPYWFFEKLFDYIVDTQAAQKISE